MTDQAPIGPLTGRSTRQTVEFRSFADAEHEQLLRTSFLTSTAMFAIVLLLERILLGARFEVWVVLLVAGVLAIEGLMVGLRNRKHLPAPGQLWRSIIVVTNGWLWMFLSATHTEATDPVPYLYEFAVLQITFGYFFTGLMLKPATITGVLIALPLPVLLFLIGYQDAEGLTRVGLVFITVNVIGHAGRRWIEHVQRLQFQRMQNLKAEATSDPLTGAANRRGLQRGIETSLEHAIEHGESIGIATVDMDNFKSINDQYGHAVGDQALCEVSRVLHSVARRGFDTVARIGGDEFAVVWSARHAKDIHERAQALQEAAGTMVTASGVKLSASIGVLIAAKPTEATEADALLNASDKLAMIVKRMGGKGLIVREWIPGRHDGRLSDSTPGFGTTTGLSSSRRS